MAMEHLTWENHGKTKYRAITIVQLEFMWKFTISWPLIKYHWLFLWDYTFSKWGQFIPYNWYFKSQNSSMPPARITCTGQEVITGSHKVVKWCPPNVILLLVNKPHQLQIYQLYTIVKLELCSPTEFALSGGSTGPRATETPRTKRFLGITQRLR